ncbi:MAG: hypothetical protein J0I21_18100 [Alphaproteobacteria bacterium]|nr:hypothetical protein [Alphaproteobacteria bacterium]
MSESEPSPPEPAPAGPEPAPPPERRNPWPVVLGVCGFLVLLAGLIWLGVQQQELALRGDPAGLAALRDEVRALQARLAALPAAPDLAPFEQRMAALEARRPAAGAPAEMSAKLGQAAADAAAAKSAAADLAGRVTALEQRLQTAEQQAATLTARAKSAQALTRAAVALAAGEPLGEIPDAPPALARFATAAPPTEARLREEFPAAAAAAERASQPVTEGQSFWVRAWLRMRSLVTVRQGDRVLVGPPAARALGEASARLAAGDLAGAVAGLDRLDAPARAAMDGWRARAQALLDARAALAQMARG